MNMDQLTWCFIIKVGVGGGGGVGVGVGLTNKIELRNTKKINMLFHGLI